MNCRLEIDKRAFVKNYLLCPKLKEQHYLADAKFKILLTIIDAICVDSRIEFKPVLDEESRLQPVIESISTNICFRISFL